MALFFWWPYFLVIKVLIFISLIFYRIHHKQRTLETVARRIYFKSGFTAVLWTVDFINFFFKEDDIMAKIFGIKPGQPYDYRLKDQEKDPEDDQIIFVLKPLDVLDAAEISDMIYSAKGFGKKREEQLKSGTQQLAILRKGMVGWRNFFYDDEEEVVFEDVSGAKNRTERIKIMDRNLNKLPTEIRDELADEIRGTSSIDLD